MVYNIIDIELTSNKLDNHSSTTPKTLYSIFGNPDIIPNTTKVFPTQLMDLLRSQKHDPNLLEEVQALIDNTPNINIADGFEHTALLRVVLSKTYHSIRLCTVDYDSIIELLLRNGSDILAVAKTSQTLYDEEEKCFENREAELIPIDYIHHSWLKEKIFWAQKADVNNKLDMNLLKQLWRGVEHLRKYTSKDNIDYTTVNELFEGYSKLINDKVKFAKAECMSWLKIMFLLDQRYYDGFKAIMKSEIFPKLLDNWIFEEDKKNSLLHTNSAEVSSIVDIMNVETSLVGLNT